MRHLTFEQRIDKLALMFKESKAAVDKALQPGMIAKYLLLADTLKDNRDSNLAANAHKQRLIQQGRDQQDKKGK